MKRFLVYTPALFIFSFLFACGNPSQNNDVNSADSMYDESRETAPTLDTLRRDSTDTIGQPLPTPPLN
ncbi:hypothetical protein [Sphingobacterium sp. LRF_L2]|uniref:hypothetical protein n=1 Tax=Sphingobacterium sp. LRF_L2 TaxID=3369421 RepID=UPI003F60DCA8